MRFFVVDAFTQKPFYGNPAGVVLLNNDHAISKETMLNIAKEVRFSETAFVRQKSDNEFLVLYFTPVSEIDLCGHATIASFYLLKEEGIIQENKKYIAHTRAGAIEVTVEDGKVMMEQAEPKMMDISEETSFDESMLAELLGIEQEDIGDERYNLKPRIVSTGLWDMIIPVKSKKALFTITPDLDGIEDFCRVNNIVSFHVFTLDEHRALANCRDFAPLYGIPEESATGTANGALIYYLYRHGVVQPDVTYEIIQGESMGRESNIFTSLRYKDGIYKAFVGGYARIIVKGDLYI
ncbi:MAG: PhzF family phenazine biosynthesis protein [Fervidobacterium sp.]|uniref:PhzF family phenazine biosynthesis protein n=1 Tax=Fervidobacterium sp. TaxID=1871331 RepID=UPI00404B3A4F